MSGPGMGGHQSAAMKKDEWLTPPGLLIKLGAPDVFDLDPCSPAVPPWPIAKARYTEADNGLRKPWFGRVWMNPPYGRETGMWLARLADHGDGIALIFARTETADFFEQVWEKASAVLFLRCRLFFHHVSGKVADHNAGAPSCLVAYGAECVEMLANAGLDGQLIRLNKQQEQRGGNVDA
jgi:hypothetical protein